MPATRTPIEQELLQLSEAFGVARALVSQGAPVDLSGMDAKVKEFCDHVHKVDAATRAKIEPDFAALLVLLNDLETELRRAGAEVTPFGGDKGANQR